MRPLAEKYRPQTWADVVGQDKVVGRLKTLADRGGLGGRAYWLSGQSGTGKTTLARLIGAALAEPWNVHEYDAADLTADELRTIEVGMAYRGIGGRPGKCWVVNEAHGLRVDQVRRLLTLLEPEGGLPSWCAFVFTTTVEGQAALFEGCDDASPLLSRCLRLDLARRDLARPFAERAKQIAEAEGLDGQPIERYVKLAQTHRNNLRAILQSIDAGDMTS